MSFQFKLCLALSLALWLAFPGVRAGTLVTRWAAGVSSTNVLPEYPRPQLVREQWQNLNGLWDYALAGPEQNAPRLMTNKILVPFAIESYLSGVQKPLDDSTLWYRRRFTVPLAWRGQNVQLHFGAVDWAAKVFLNGRQLGGHRGGYDAFSFDITTILNWDGENELLVRVNDPTGENQARGKQSRKPEGVFYTSVSGIWQTVWLEPVPAVHISGLTLVPDFKTAALRASLLVNTAAEGLRVEITASFKGQQSGHSEGLYGTDITVPLSPVHLWSPEVPSLYDVEIKLFRGRELLDRVRSYCGLREIRLGTDDGGRNRLFLNGQPLFEMGVLDQGYWPDGLYTAPSDEALRFDLETAKRLGFNLVRKHLKVETERWYYWADRLGLLVWQDMPSCNNTSEPARRQFEMELYRLVEQKVSHPCIVMWVLFNEGWGQFETERLARRLKVFDPTRLVDSDSGYADLKAGDVIDLHNYPEPMAPTAEPARAGVLGEFGGLYLDLKGPQGFLGVTGHGWSDSVWGYLPTSDSLHMAGDYATLVNKVWDLQKSKGLAAAVYTQLVDVETECNGFLTYDRTVLKADADEVRRANLRQATSHPSPMLLPDARRGSFSWSYTTNTPPPEWMQPGFVQSDWLMGTGGFGTEISPGVIVRTAWSTDDIWLRREFVLKEGFEPPFAVTMNHDEDAEVYLNGTLAVRASDYAIGYQEFQLGAEAGMALHAGRNVMAVHCHQTKGGQYIDAGLLARPGSGE